MINKKVFLRCFVIGLLAILSSCHSRKVVSTSSNNTYYNLEIKKSLNNEISNWIGTPYKFGGNDKNGVDCSGLVCAIYKKVYSKSIPRTSKQQFEACKRVPFENLKEGDLVFFDFEKKGVSHVGIYLRDGKFLHASSSKGVIIADINNPYFKSHFVGGGRI